MPRERSQETLGEEGMEDKTEAKETLGEGGREDKMESKESLGEWGRHNTMIPVQFNGVTVAM